MTWRTWWASPTTSIYPGFTRIPFLMVAAILASLGVALVNTVTGLTFSDTFLSALLVGLLMLGMIAYLVYLLPGIRKGGPPASMVDNGYMQVHDTGQPVRRAQRTNRHALFIATLNAAGHRLRAALGRHFGAVHAAIGLGTRPLSAGTAAGAGIKMLW